MTEPAVDPAQPWLGLHSFSESTRSYFYGREDEIAELARRVQRKLLTVLFGQSGLRGARAANNAVGRRTDRPGGA
jgi:hypothetical protein